MSQLCCNNCQCLNSKCSSYFRPVHFLSHNILCKKNFAFVSHFLLTCPKTDHPLLQSNPGEDDLTKPMRCMPPFKNVVANLPVRVSKMMPTVNITEVEFDWKAGQSQISPLENLDSITFWLQRWILILQVDPLEMTCGVQKAAEYCIQVLYESINPIKHQN